MPSAKNSSNSATTHKMVGTKIPKDGKYQIKKDDKSGVTQITTEETFYGKKVVVIGIVGCFHEVETTKQIPAFVKKMDEFKKRGVDSVAIVTVSNDAHVARAWVKYEFPDLPSTGIQVLTDGTGGVVGDMLHLTQHQGGVGLCALRHVMYAEDGVIKALEVENEGLEEYKVSTPERILAAIDSVQSGAESASSPTSPTSGKKRNAETAKTPAKKTKKNDGTPAHATRSKKAKNEEEEEEEEESAQADDAEAVEAE